MRGFLPRRCRHGAAEEGGGGPDNQHASHPARPGGGGAVLRREAVAAGYAVFAIGIYFSYTYVTQLRVWSAFGEKSERSEGVRMHLQICRIARPRRYGAIAGLIIVIAGLMIVDVAHAKPVLTTLYSFCAQSGCPDGSQPYAGVIFDKSGNLYGTTEAGGPLTLGTVFRLSPPAKGKDRWTEAVLHGFVHGRTNGDGAYPFAGVIFDEAGNLYGTTRRGGSADGGVVFELLPPAKGKTAWTESRLHSFPECTGVLDGCGPSAAVIFDGAGNLYSTTAEGGTIGSGGSGTVFELSPPAEGKTVWTEVQLHRFKGGSDGDLPAAGVIFDHSGNLYGAIYYDDAGFPNESLGEVFKLSPPATGEKGWTKAVLYTFKNIPDGEAPDANLIFDDSGNLYGTTVYGGIYCDARAATSCGVVFELSPPASGKTKWTEKVLYKFRGGSSDGTEPTAALIRDKDGNLYGTTFSGGDAKKCPSIGFFAGCGIVFELSPPARGTTVWTETVLHIFTGGNDGASPSSGLIFDGKGNLYGTTSGVNSRQHGTVFMLTP